MDGQRLDLAARGRVVKDHGRAKLSSLEAPSRCTLPMRFDRAGRTIWSRKNLVAGQQMRRRILPVSRTLALKLAGPVAVATAAIAQPVDFKPATCPEVTRARE